MTAQRPYEVVLGLLHCFRPGHCTPGCCTSVRRCRDGRTTRSETKLNSCVGVCPLFSAARGLHRCCSVRDRALSLPVDLDTQFGIGSVSKIFVAASVLILVQEGRLELDKPVTEYLPEFVMQDERYKDITVRILLNHTSGIPRTNNKDSMTAVKNRAFVQETLERLQTTCLINDPGRIITATTGLQWPRPWSNASPELLRFPRAEHLQRDGHDQHQHLL